MQKQQHRHNPTSYRGLHVLVEIGRLILDHETVFCQSKGSLPVNIAIWIKAAGASLEHMGVGVEQRMKVMR